MASLYSATTEGEEALAASASETLVQLRGATVVKAKIVEISVSFDATTADWEPVRIDLLRQTTDGTGTGATEVPLDPDYPTANCTAFHSFTAEPTAGDILFSWEVHPQGGLLVVQYPLGREPTLDNLTTSRIGLRATTPSGVTPNALAYMVWEE